MRLTFLDMIDINERPPGRTALSIRTRLIQVEWDLDKRLKARYGPCLSNSKPNKRGGGHNRNNSDNATNNENLSDNISGVRVLVHPSNSTSISCSGSISPSPSDVSYSPPTDHSTSCSPRTDQFFVLPTIFSNDTSTELDDGWCSILNKVREANSKLLGMDRTFSPLPFSPGSKHFPPSGGMISVILLYLCFVDLFSNF